MTTFSRDYSPLIDSHVHVDVTAVSRDKTHTTFVYFAFVNYDTRNHSPELIPLFGANHNTIGVPNHHANDENFVIDQALNAVTMRYGDTDLDFFDTYTQDESDFARSWLCEALCAECDCE